MCPRHSIGLEGTDRETLGEEKDRKRHTDRDKETGRQKERERKGELFILKSNTQEEGTYCSKAVHITHTQTDVASFP